MIIDRNYKLTNQIPGRDFKILDRFGDALIVNFYLIVGDSNDKGEMSEVLVRSPMPPNSRSDKAKSKRFMWRLIQNRRP